MKSTEELKNRLQSTHPSDLAGNPNELQDILSGNMQSFESYMREKFTERGLSQREVFIRADIPERYGYKLFSGQKRTRKRDLIYRVCYVAGFDLEETQKAFRLYQLPELYPRNHRDAVLIVALNARERDIFEVSSLLSEQGEEPLYACEKEG